MEPDWPSCEKYSNYRVARDGRIVNKKGNCLLKPTDGEYKYIRLHNSFTNNRDNIGVHRLVALTYIPNPKNLPCVNHKDGNSKS